MNRQKIPGWVQLGWTIAMLLVDFVSAAFLVLLLGSLHIGWGYWHAWWVIFLGSWILSSVVMPIVARLEYLIEHQR